MRHIIPAIVATVQILIGFFFFFTLVMISIHMVSPVIMPDAHVGPTWTLIQCMTPGAVVAGVGVLWGLVMFPAGYVAQYIVTPRVILWWRARTLGETARLIPVLATNLDGCDPNFPPVSPGWTLITCDNKPDLDAQEETCKTCQTLFMSDEPMECQYLDPDIV